MARSVTLTFHLQEEVTPEIFTQKVIEALVNHGTLRKGEGVQLGAVNVVITDILPAAPLPWEKPSGE